MMYYDPDKECSDLVQRMRKICAAKGISMYAAARKANISVSTLNEIMNEKTRPQLYTLFKICNALEIRMGDLFHDSITSENESKERSKSTMIEYQYLPKWKQKMVDQYVSMVAQYESEE